MMRKQGAILFGAFLLLAGVFALSGIRLAGYFGKLHSENEQFEVLRQSVTESPTPVAEPDLVEGNTVPTMLPHMEKLHRKNPDIAAWIRIDGTGIDYPVMSTPDEPQRYLHLGFDEQYSKSGVPFISGTMEDDNLVIHGHNMKNRTMFSDLLGYEQQEFWDTHKIIGFDTLYDRMEYEVIAAFRTRAFSPNEDGFRYYRYTNFESESDFDSFMEQVKAAALFDTDVTSGYGDSLITLSTCSYHEANGRFVVVARIV